MEQTYSGGADLTHFEFNNHMIQHQCVDGVDADALKVKKVDGRSL